MSIPDTNRHDSLADLSNKVKKIKSYLDDALTRVSNEPTIPNLYALEDVVDRMLYLTDDV